MQHNPRNHEPKPSVHVFRLVLVYLAAGCTYILLSDYLVSSWLTPDEFIFVQSFKGIAFVAVTAFLLYAVLSTYRRRLNRVLAHSEHTDSALIAALERYPGPAAIFDKNRRLVFANSYSIDLLGASESNTIGKTLDELQDDGPPQAFRDYFEHAYTTGEPAGGELVVKRGEREKYFVTNLVPTIAEGKMVQNVFALAYDISDRKQSAIRLEMQRRELRQIIDLIPNFVFAKDATGHYILANEAFSRFHGLSPAEVIGQTVNTILPPYDVTTDIISQDNEVIEQGVPVYRACQPVTRYDGETRMFQVTKIPFQSAADNTTALLGVAIDITDQLQHEQAINKNRERFRALVEHSLDALFVYDKSGIITLVNERACDVVDMPSKELIGESLQEILLREEMWPSIDSRPPLFEAGSIFQMIIGKGPKAKHVEVRVGALPGEDEGAYLAELRDISERVRTERESMILSRLGVELSAARNATEIGKSLLNAARSSLTVDAFFFAIRISGKSRFRQKVLADTVEGELRYFPEMDFEREMSSRNRDYYDGKSSLLLRQPENPLEDNFAPFGDTQRRSRSLMFVPVSVNDQVMALMSVQSYDYDAYTQDNLKLLEHMANMAAPALESAQATRRAEIFARLGRELGAARTAKQVAEHVAIMGDELVGWDCCTVALYSGEEDSVTYIYLADLVNGVRQKLDEPYPFKKPQQFAARVLDEGPFLVLRDEVPDSNDFLPLGKSTRPSMSMIWVPIPGASGSIGFISFQSYTRDAYDHNDLKSICALADHCGAAIDRTASQELLRYREDRYRRAIESIGAAAYQLDYNTRSYIFMGQQIEAITGFPPQEFCQGLWKKITLKIEPDPACEFTEDEEGRKFCKQWRAEICIRRRDGSEGWLSDQSVQLQNAAGKPIGTLGILRDITDQKQHEIALLASEERYALSARGANDGLWDWDLIQNTIHFSDRWGEMLGLAPDEIFNDPEKWFDLIHPDDVVPMKRMLNDHFSGKSRHLECEVRTKHKKGTYCWMLVRGIAVRDAAGTATRIAGSQTDITDRIQTQERLLHDALHDPLTGLPNRTLLMEHLDRCLENMKRRPGSSFALVFMDLDRFKTINDSLGHLTGDSVLLTIAQRLKRSIRPMDVVARFAGDEFALVLENVDCEEEVLEIVARAQAVVAEPMTVEHHEIITTASTGIAMGSGDYEHASDLLRDADNALYKAKTDGAGRCRMFDSSMHEQAVRTLHLEADLRRVIERQQLRLYFQPLVNLKNGQIERFEALLRWQHPDRGMITPDQFMPIAEETGLIFALDEWVIGEACRWWKRWQGVLNTEKTVGHDTRINLNLSPRHFGRHINLAERFENIIYSEGLQPELFGLELTENAILTFREETTVALNKLKDAGFSLYLDDFGKGYSSLSYLHSFPFDVVKIDRQFVMRMQDEGPEMEIVHAILALAGKLNLGVVAEGVETAAQLEMVRNMGCDFGQGYYISRPTPPNKALELITTGRRW